MWGFQDLACPGSPALVCLPLPAQPEPVHDHSLRPTRGNVQLHVAQVAAYLTSTLISDCETWYSAQSDPGAASLAPWSHPAKSKVSPKRYVNPSPTQAWIRRWHQQEAQAGAVPIQ